MVGLSVLGQHVLNEQACTPCRPCTGISACAAEAVWQPRPWHHGRVALHHCGWCSIRWSFRVPVSVKIRPPEPAQSCPAPTVEQVARCRGCGSGAHEGCRAGRTGLTKLLLSACGWHAQAPAPARAQAGARAEHPGAHQQLAVQHDSAHVAQLDPSAYAGQVVLRDVQLVRDDGQDGAQRWQVWPGHMILRSPPRLQTLVQDDRRDGAQRWQVRPGHMILHSPHQASDAGACTSRTARRHSLQGRQALAGDATLYRSSFGADCGQPWQAERVIMQASSTTPADFGGCCCGLLAGTRPAAAATAVSLPATTCLASAAARLQGEAGPEVPQALRPTGC